MDEEEKSFWLEFVQSKLQDLERICRVKGRRPSPREILVPKLPKEEQLKLIMDTFFNEKRGDIVQPGTKEFVEENFELFLRLVKFDDCSKKIY